MTLVTTGFAERGSHRIAYEIIGDDKAPPVLLVMGMAFSSRAWDTLPARLTNAGYRVVMFDNRGTGRSSVPAGFFRISDMADDAAAVLDAAHIDRANVFGVSMGGMISLELVLRHPERVTTLALGCTYASWRQSEKPQLAITRAVLSSAVKGAETLERIAPVLIADETWRDRRDEFASWMTRVERGPPRVVGRQLAAVVRHSADRRLSRIVVPTLVVTGDVDRLVPPKNSAVLANGIARAEHVTIRGAGHCFPFERPDETTAALVSLFRRA
jgi:pimeloyl-ACP methyl ester carboxylesterase